MTATVATLLLGISGLFIGGRLAKRAGWPEASGFGVALCLMALAFVLLASDWRAWLAGGEAGDQLLGYARTAGVAGLLFLAGTRFHTRAKWDAWRAPLFTAVAGAALLILISVVLIAFAGVEPGVAVLLGASVAASSPWIQSELSSKGETRGVAFNSALLTSILGVTLVHFSAAFHALGGRKLTFSAYLIVALYESVKVIVFFAAAYFVASRFIGRAEGRVSATRIRVAYLLISALIFLLAASSISQPAALAWVFMAGVVWRRTEAGRKFGESYQPITLAILAASAFLPLLLQSHGRTLESWPTLLAVTLAALAVKYGVVWGGAKLAGLWGREARKVAAALLSPGEVAIVLLGFAVTGWAVDGPAYYGLVAFTLLALALGPVVGRLVARETGDTGSSRAALPGRAGVGKARSQSRRERREASAPAKRLLSW